MLKQFSTVLPFLTHKATQRGTEQRKNLILVQASHSTLLSGPSAFSCSFPLSTLAYPRCSLQLQYKMEREGIPEERGVYRFTGFIGQTPNTLSVTYIVNIMTLQVPYSPLNPCYEIQKCIFFSRCRHIRNVDPLSQKHCVVISHNSTLSPLYIDIFIQRYPKLLLSYSYTPLSSFPFCFSFMSLL